jgi:hypothetical protein
MDFITTEKYKIFDALNQKPLIPLKTYPLNQANIKRYIEASAPELREVLNKIFKNTKHISYKTFKFILNNNFKEFLHYCNVNNITSVILFLDNINFNKITSKSNFWVAQHFYQYIKNKNINLNIKIIYNYTDIQYLDNNELILIIDDCAYSGSQLSDILSKKFNFPNKKFRIYLIITFISEAAIKLITKSIHKNTLILSKNKIIIYPISHYLTPKDYKFYPTKYLIYFDHKLADEVSIITSIYNGIVIDNIKYLKGVYQQNPVIIPIISNCEHIITKDKINLFSPLCPPSPYKHNSSDGTINENIFKKFSSLSTSSTLKLNVKSSPLLKKTPIRNLSDPQKKNIRKKNPKNKINFEKPEEQTVNNQKYKNKLYEKFKANFIKKPLYIPITTYPLDKNAITTYINASDPTIAPILTKIFDNTLHISYNTFNDKLNECFTEFISYCVSNNITNVMLFISLNDYPNYWIAQHFMRFIYLHKITSINFITINNIYDIDNKYLIVLFTDCIYMPISVNFILYNLNKITANTAFYILCPYISKYAKNIIDTTFAIDGKKSLTYSTFTEIQSIKIILTQEEMLALHSFFQHDFATRFLIYFDHCMHITDSCYNIYQGYINNNSNNRISLILNCSKNNCPPNIFYINDKNYKSNFIINKKQPKKKNETVKKCPEGKILNPKTNRCIKIKKSKETNETNKTLNTQIKKECPEGKILNPNTNRCIKIKKSKETNETNKTLNTQIKKECPEGKILNPNTNRCIKI